VYTGIVQALLTVVHCKDKPGLKTFGIELPSELQADLELGASIAVNGCCFTVTTMRDSYVEFDAIAETLSITNIKNVSQGSRVNIERSAKADAEIGGHILSGHIVDTAQVVSIDHSENNVRICFQGKADWLKYVFNKGFLAVNGCSLTVAALDTDAMQFSINLIPETLDRTNFSLLQAGDEVNIEVEQQTQVIVDTVERVMAERYAMR